MKTKILVIALLAVVALACSKNAYNTKPTLKIKSVSKTYVPFQEPLVIELEVTDKEGDVTDTLFLKKMRLNQRTTATLANDSLYFQIPDAPNSSDGIVHLELGYNDYLVSAIDPNGPGNTKINDTIIFKFALRDKAKNVSDTVTTEPIVIERR